jgi:hypothetical protein
VSAASMTSLSLSTPPFASTSDVSLRMSFAATSESEKGRDEWTESSPDAAILLYSPSRTSAWLARTPHATACRQGSTMSVTHDLW